MSLLGLEVRRFGSFQLFAVVPMEDCRAARALLEGEVLCVDSLFMNVEELHWLRKGPRADPDICPGHHCAAGWVDHRGSRL